MERAVSFYRDTLGLPVTFQDGDKWAQFNAGESNFSLSSPDEGASDASGGVIIFEVESIDQFSKKIEKSQGSIIEVRDMGDHGKVLTFKDPDENIVQLFQRKK
tara:strand:- start:3744 stop:4052 length:309 start_codon:yes stop_codon:yes gene_type:complete